MLEHPEEGADVASDRSGERVDSEHEHAEADGDQVLEDDLERMKDGAARDVDALGGVVHLVHPAPHEGPSMGGPVQEVPEEFGGDEPHRDAADDAEARAVQQPVLGQPLHWQEKRHDDAEPQDGHQEADAHQSPEADLGEHAGGPDGLAGDDSDVRAEREHSEDGICVHGRSLVNAGEPRFSVEVRGSKSRIGAGRASGFA